jgi:small ligand-binding sensory domain FIST
VARVLLSGRLDARLQRDVALEKNIVVKVNIEGVIGDSVGDSGCARPISRPFSSTMHVSQV